MAENQGNFISKFAPKSHFFTDPAAISQTAEHAFGPVSENPVQTYQRKRNNEPQRDEFCKHGRYAGSNGKQGDHYTPSQSGALSKYDLQIG